MDNVKIIERINEVCGIVPPLDAYDADVISSLIDLDIAGVTEDMMLKVIEAEGLNIVEDGGDFFDADTIKAYADKIGYSKPKKKSGKKTSKKSEPAVPAVDPANPFGMFEQMINSVVVNQSAPLVESMVNDRLDGWVQENSNKITKKIEYIAPSGKTMDAITHKEFERIVQIVQLKQPLLLVGSAGTGKNYLCKQVADFLDLEFYFANAVTQEHKLTGFIDANGVYHETQFYKAFTQGGLFMFDEIDASDAEVLVTFNAMLANGYMDFPTGREYAHENFRVIAAANTFGNGASYEYVGRTQLDAATLDRFTTLIIDYDERIENSLTDDTSLLEFIRTFRGACAEYGINHIASYRAIERCRDFVDLFGAVDALKIGLVKNLERDDMNMLVHKFEGLSDRWSTAFCEIARGC